MLAYEFFRNALLGGLLVSILCAMVGTYVVTRRMVIVGGGMAHASLGGVGLGAYLGFSPLLGAALFAVFSGYSIDFLSRRNVREDAAIAMLWTLGMSLGILFAYLTPGFMTDLPSYLFGNILFITREDLWLLLLLVVAVSLFFGLLLTPIVTIAYDRDFAVTQGLPVRWIEALMILFMALTLVVSLRLCGIFAVSAATDGRHLLPHVSQYDALRRSLCLFRHRLRLMGRRPAKSARRGVHYDLHDPAIRTLSLHQSNKNKENKLV